MTIDRAKSHILTEKSAGVWLFFYTEGKICIEKRETTQSVVAISSLGTQNSKERKKIFLEGYEEMIKRLDPAQIIFYGRVPEECKGNIVHIESFSEKFHKAEVAQW